MEKTKFWLLQIVMALIVSLVFGSPVLADDDDDDDGRRSHQQLQHDDDDDDDDAFNDAAWHERWEKKQLKKEAKYERKLANIRAKYDGDKLARKEQRLNDRYARWGEKRQTQMELHYAEYHPGEPLPSSEEPLSCSSENPDLCTNSDECMGAGGGWFPDFGGCLFF